MKEASSDESLSQIRLVHAFSAVADLGNELVEEKDFEQLMRTALQILLGSLAIFRGGIARWSPDTNSVSMLSLRGLDGEFPLSLALSSEDIAYFAANGVKPIETSEVPHLPFFKFYRAVFEAKSINLTVPLVFGSEVLGLVLLGPKASGKAYSSFDKEVVSAISRFIGAALRNRELSIQLSLSADEILKLNGILKETYSKILTMCPDGEAAVEMEEFHSIQVPAAEVGEDVRRFCGAILSGTEISRLRDELQREALIRRAVEKFNSILHEINSDGFWSEILNVCAELVQAERGSLMIFDEQTGETEVAAAAGVGLNVLKSDGSGLGNRLAMSVIKDLVPLVVSDVKDMGLTEVLSERQYKTASFISFPFIIDEHRVGLINLADRVDGRPFKKYDLALLDAVAPQFGKLIDRANLICKYQQLSMTDPLTGLLNRRYLTERLAEELSRSSRSGDEMSLMMIDVDDFKSYNDSFGHSEGDKALRLVARCLRGSIRGDDTAVRFGGEEFAVLLPRTTLREGVVIAERVRDKICSAIFPNRRVTVSIGLASSVGQDLPDSRTLLEAADKALYEAKRAGRNTVRILPQSQ